MIKVNIFVTSRKCYTKGLMVLEMRHCDHGRLVQTVKFITSITHKWITRSSRVASRSLLPCCRSSLAVYFHFLRIINLSQP